MSAGRAWGGALLAVSVVLLCLIPKPEGDLFFALRIGEDILRSGRLPHADAYSWTQAGTRWDVPEWGAFVLSALAYRAAALAGLDGLLGPWALMTALALATAWVVWVRLAGRVGPAWAFPLVSLMLLAMSSCLQERPYAFSYLLLAVGLGWAQEGAVPQREGGPHPARRGPHPALPRRRERVRSLQPTASAQEAQQTVTGPSPILMGEGRVGAVLGAWRLPALCVVWTNLHQGVVVLPGLLLLYAVGEALTGDRARAGRTALAGLACGPAVMASPYGWRVYANIFVTLRDRPEMAHITEWEPVWTLPPGQLAPFFLLAALTVGALALSRRRPRLPDALALAALGGEALLHVRDVALFAVGALVLLAPHLGTLATTETSAAPRVRSPAGVSVVLGLLALAYVGTAGLVAAATLRRAGLGRDGVGLGAAVAELGDYPGGAAAFLDSGAGPRPRRLLNDLGDGGFLLWRAPGVPVFIDGRLDVYGGRTFDDNLVLVRADGSPAWAALVRRYDFDAVLTRSRREAAAFAALPGWRLVYADPPRPGHPCHRLLVRAGVQ